MNNLKTKFVPLSEILEQIPRTLEEFEQSLLKYSESSKALEKKTKTKFISLLEISKQISKIKEEFEQGLYKQSKDLENIEEDSMIRIKVKHPSFLKPVREIWRLKSEYSKENNYKSQKEKQF